MLGLGFASRGAQDPAPPPSQTTGLAEPAPVVQTFFADTTLKKTFRLDAVLARLRAGGRQAKPAL